MLNRLTAKTVVKLNGLVGSSAVLVLSRVLANPEVEVPGKGVGAKLSGVEQNIGVAIVELAKLGARKIDQGEVLATPDLEARGLPNSGNGWKEGEIEMGDEGGINGGPRVVVRKDSPS